jgi:hypothetical protein
MAGGIRILGVLFIVLGITFLIWGLNQSDTFANRVVKEMSGSDTAETKRYIFGGITMLVVGAGILSLRFFRRKK